MIPPQQIHRVWGFYGCLKCWVTWAGEKECWLCGGTDVVPSRTLEEQSPFRAEVPYYEVEGVA